VSGSQANHQFKEEDETVQDEKTRRKSTKRGNGEGSITNVLTGSGAARSALTTIAARRSTARRAKDVSRKLATALQAREDGTIVVAPCQTLVRFIERCLEDSVKRTTRPRSYISYRDRMRLHILPDLGRIQLSSLTPQHLQRLYSPLLKTGLSTTTINGSHMVLHHALQQPLRWGTHLA
jgi:Phage integrase, N-terminal SAM-like domain